MSSKRAATDGSPSASTLSLPHPQQSPRGSIVSASQIDKTLSQTLDQINQHASHTDTLTTFNEYTSPPLSSSSGDGKGFAGELQGGLSGLYSRFRVSVGNFRDIVNHTAENAALDEQSTRIPKQAPSPSSPTSTTRSKPQNLWSPNLPINAEDSVLSHTPAREESEISPPADQERAVKPTKLALGAPTSQVKATLTPSLPLKSPLASLAPPTTVVSPAVAEANVADGRVDYRILSKDTVTSATFASKAEEQLNETFNKQNSPAVLPDPFTSLASDAGAEAYSRTVAEHTSEAAHKLKDERTSQEIEEQANDENSTAQGVNYFTPNEQPLRPPTIVTHPGTPQTAPLRAPQVATTDFPGNTPVRASAPSTPAMASPASAQSLTQSQQSLDQKKGDTSSSRTTNSQIRMANPKWQDFDGLSKGLAPQIRNRILSKDFWMKDENARDCFYCGDAFSTFRRKHHCSK